MKSDRHSAIRDLLVKTSVTSQDELRRKLASKGYHVTQATLSRDFAKLKARRTALPEGGTVYELAENSELMPAAAPSVLMALRNLIVSVDHNDSLVVVTTTPGAN